MSIVADRAEEIREIITQQLGADAIVESRWATRDTIRLGPATRAWLVRQDEAFQLYRLRLKDSTCELSVTKAVLEHYSGAEIWKAVTHAGWPHEDERHSAWVGIGGGDLHVVWGDFFDRPRQ